jgi:proliferating cell nuclear antigen
MKIIEIQTVQSSVIKTLTEALKEILDDVIINISPPEIIKDEDGNEKEYGGIKINAINNNDDILVHLHLQASKFEVYRCRETMNIGVNMTNLFKLLRTMNSSDMLTLFIEDTDKNKLGIRIENSEKNSITNYKLNLIDLNDQEIIIPSTTFTTIVRLPSNYFHKLCKDMSNITQDIEIKSFSNKLVLSSYRGDGDFAEQTTMLTEKVGDDVDNNSLRIIKRTDNDEIVQGVFELKNLTLFTKCTGLCPDIEIKMKNDYPLVIVYKVASLGEITLCLSQKNINTEVDYESD